MKPYVICHMVASVDGRTLISRWRPEDPSRRELFERLHERLAVDAWLIGRITGQEYAKRDAYPGHTDQHYAREPWFARRDAAAYGIVLDAHGKIAWGRGDIGDDPIVVVRGHVFCTFLALVLRKELIDRLAVRRSRLEWQRIVDDLADLS